MGDKRNAAMAGLPWPTSERPSTNPRTTGSTDSEMTDDIGHESFPSIATAAPPADTSHCHHPFSLGNAQYTPSTSRSGTWTVRLALCMLRRSTNKGLFVNSIRSISFTSSPVITIRLTRCRTIGAPTTAFLWSMVALHSNLHGHLPLLHRHRQLSRLQPSTLRPSSSALKRLTNWLPLGQLLLPIFRTSLIRDLQRRTTCHRTGLPTWRSFFVNWAPLPDL